VDNPNGIKRLYSSISEVSNLVDEEQYVLRYWETEFDQLCPQKNRSGNRIYTDHDIRVINAIKYLLRTKRYTIDGAKERLATMNFDSILAEGISLDDNATTPQLERRDTDVSETDVSETEVPSDGQIDGQTGTQTDGTQINNVPTDTALIVVVGSSNDSTIDATLDETTPSATLTEQYDRAEQYTTYLDGQTAEVVAGSIAIREEADNYHDDDDNTMVESVVEVDEKTVQNETMADAMQPESLEIFIETSVESSVEMSVDISAHVTALPMTFTRQELHTLRDTLTSILRLLQADTSAPQ
jgi:DNA-binding transcriptional MerR regulator